MTKLFTEDEVIKLCTAIRNRRSLYDPADPNFGKSLANKAVWDEISQMFAHKEFTADDVKLKWKNLRDTMALLLRKSNRDPNTWRFYEYCSFLNNYERPPRKNARKPANGIHMERPTKLETLISGSERDPDEPSEKQFKPTMVVSSNTTTKSEDLVEQSDSSRDSNFEDTHDSLLKHFVTAHAQNGGVIQSSTLLQTPISQVQSPYPSSHLRDVYEIFGEETAIRLRTIAESGNKTLFVHARRKINEVLENVELEMYAKQSPSEL
jgi:hypothetical protein